ncbi:NAD(P)/FAD-dependent oxidoreductase [Flavobacterium sp. CYK-55]|uniref:NAD(P)/FAD-dependent oxidoreductase n=1 Tax=Flavobacterium sp. CYK-55 TaxID=2835529 RepID=UPI001BD1B12E|nr:NAD(P)/FAD-dependent oxidoreductase [Flavobacterium sp. CYK-55]MBS7787202.1 NAD(P)/FAD-dependent oxidoreductase [Flavobacterium sp. CYK-55]
MKSHYDIIVVGGGAAGFFTAINIAELKPEKRIAILERGKNVLEKVRISGGGRCNVTHACFVPDELIRFYPRGEKELRGPFHQFCSGDTIEWFEKHGVALKIEDDGRMFPTSDSSQTIIDCFLEAAKNNKIDILTGQSVQSIFKSEKHWKIDTPNQNFSCDQLVMATGSNPKIWELLEKMGHSIIAPVPSLFTFNIKDPRIKELMGLSALAQVKVKGTNLDASGPLLITHWGMSGPGILRLSAWGARILADKNYQFALEVNWLNGLDFESTEDVLKTFKLDLAKKVVAKQSPFALTNNLPIDIRMPNRLWEKLTFAAGINADEKWADLNKNQIKKLAQELFGGVFQVNGKSTFKEEFVTAGGIDLREINFKTMQSKLHENLYFAGEILNIDAITGGFNFQNAWTGGFIVAKNI